MKNTIILILFLTFYISSCKKGNSFDPDLASVTTSAVTSIGSETAVSGGEVTSQGIDSVVLKGVCWSASSNPTISDSKVTSGSGLGSFVSYITGLSSNTKYHVRAFASNGKGTAYGKDIEFTTGNISGQSFSATIDGEGWASTNDLISANISTLSSVQMLTINAEHPTDGSYFALPIKYFAGSDTTINFTSSSFSTVVLYRKGTKNYNQKSGSLHITKSTSGGLETYTGTFSGTWKDLLSNTSVNITNGQFVAKRSL